MTKLTEFVKTTETAKILGVAQNTLSKWLARVEIPIHRNPASGYRLFNRNDLDKLFIKAAKPIKPPLGTKPRISK